MARKIRSVLIRSDKDFADYIKEEAKKNEKSITDITRDIHLSLKLLNGKKLRKKIIEEVSF